MALPASVTRSLPPVLVAANRPRTGRTLLCLMLADWLANVQAAACALADADAARGALARLSHGRAVTLTAARLEGGRRGLAPTADDEALVVDNADALRRGEGGSPFLDPAGQTGPAAIRHGFSALSGWLSARPAGSVPPLLCLLIEDGRDADRAALDNFRRGLPPGVSAGLVAVRNAGMPAILPTEADQHYAAAGGWPACPERQAWLASGAREMVFARPPAALLRQLRFLGEELRPDLGTDARLWLMSRQQFHHWRRHFAARAVRAFASLWPHPLGSPLP